VELVDTRDLKSLDRNIVPVQVRPRVPSFTDMENIEKKWLVATYKSNEVKRVESNLLNQNFDFYLPKIIIKKINSNPKAEVLFPGYIFINTSLKNYSALKYTSGIRDIIKFGYNISCVSDEEIEAMQMAEKASETDPLALQIQIGQDVMIARGSLTGSIAKVCSLPAKERVEVLLSFLGSMRRISIPEKDLLF
jgi:transcription antitermination factor NusG